MFFDAMGWKDLGWDGLGLDFTFYGLFSGLSDMN
jgi:hypothetical protein